MSRKGEPEPERRPKAPDEALKGRLFEAKVRLELQLRRKVTLEELGERVARAYPRRKPFAPSVVRKWLFAESEPSTRQLWRALAAALLTPVGPLMFGEDAMTVPTLPTLPLSGERERKTG